MLENLHWICLGVGCWVTVNGILHTVAVMNQHKGTYDRDYLRLLLDGLILITCGVVQILSWKLIEEGNLFGYYIAGTASLSLLVYCMLIFPFLKSIFTIVITAGLVILLVIAFLQLS